MTITKAKYCTTCRSASSTLYRCRYNNQKIWIFLCATCLHKVQKDMCKAGSWLDKVPLGVIIETVPQDSIVKLQQEALPEYRKLAANLIDQFISEFELQGGNRREITEKYESMYQWIR